MSKKFSLSSFLDTDKIIYIAPILLALSCLHIFSAVAATHSLGQIEVIAAIIVTGYYLWEKIAVIYPSEKMGKKRIEAVACIVISLFLALIPLAPLMTWQYYNLYRASDRQSYSKQILIAVVTIWVGIGIFFGSAIQHTMNIQNATNAALQESAMPSPMQGQ
jgi:hypothetical protein